MKGNIQRKGNQQGSKVIGGRTGSFRFDLRGRAWTERGGEGTLPYFWKEVQHKMKKWTLV